MPQESDTERIPLLRGPFHNTHYTLNSNDRSTFSWLGYGFTIIALLLLSINLVFYFIESNETVLPKGISNIPYEYYLGLKNDFNDFEYVIETCPQSDPKFSKFNQDSNSSFTKELSDDRLKLAEIVSRNYRAWTPAYYEVRENRHGHKNFTVLTTKSHMSGLWFIMWSPKVHVTFVASNDDDKENKNDNDGGRETRRTRFIDNMNDQVKILLKCEYEITWNYKYFGEIHRKCPNQEYWVKVAYVKGTSEWGMQWLDPERIETYGVVSKPAYGINKQMRNVVIRPDSPFPPILPALYVAYFDRIINREY